jgi:hypothetical protein
MRNGLLACILGLITTAGQAPAQTADEGGPVVQPRPPLAQELVDHINRQIWWAQDTGGRAAPPPKFLEQPVPKDRWESLHNESCAPEGPCKEVCGPDGHFWISAEYLLWWIRSTPLPPLITAGTPSSGGILGLSGTNVLFGGSDFDHDVFSGGRFTAGFWLDCEHTCGLEGSFFFLGSQSRQACFSGSGEPGSPIIARPVFDVLAGRENAELVASPGQLAGTICATLSSRLWGAEVNGITNLCCGCCYRVDLIGGFRYLELDEGLNITENLAALPGVPVIGGSTINLSDEFDAHNRFYGGQLGARAEYRWNSWYVDLLGKVALGDTHQVIGINGTTVITPPGGPTSVFHGGLLAQPTNSGHFSQDDFSVVPEVGLDVGYQVTNHFRAFVGYTFLYWSDVVRPGDQIDRAINLSQLPSTSGPGMLVGPARPAVQFKDNDFWAQGVNFGLEFRY